MNVLLIAVFVVAFAVALCWLVAPRWSWRRAIGWQFKNPGAVEPSDLAFLGFRVAAGVAMIVLFVVGVTLYRMHL